MSRPSEDYMYMGWPIGAVSLGALIGDESFIRRKDISERLLGVGIMNRPWPRHPLHYRLIELDYAAWTPPRPPEDSEVIAIRSDREIRYRDRDIPLSPAQIGVINVGLMMRDMFMKRKEMCVLLPGYTPRTINMSLFRIRRKAGTDLYEYGGKGKKSIHQRIHSKFRFVDLRPELKPGMPEFIG